MGGKGSGGRNRKREQVELATDRKPYDRQPKETDPAWAAFVQYRDMEDRSLTKAGSSLGKSTWLMGHWSSKWRWVERATAWDRERDDRARATTLDEIEEMQRRHIQLALGMQQLGTLELKRLLKDAQTKTKGIGLSATDIHKLIDAGAKLERLNRGEPETIERRELTGPNGGPIKTESKIKPGLSEETIESIKRDALGLNED